MDLKALIARRDFMKVAGASAVLLGLGGTLYDFEYDKAYLRPPGLVNEKDFLAKCIKCQKCLAVCPVRVIVPISFSEGRMQLSTPTMNFRQGYCDLCMKCVEVCPTDALQVIAKNDVKIGIAKINPDICVAWNWSGCVECSKLCPFDGIHLDAHQRPVVDALKCNGCGLCENICPSGSLRAYNNQVTGKGIVIVPIKTN